MRHVTRLLALVGSSAILVMLVRNSGVHINITVTIAEPSLQAATPQEEPPMRPEPAPAPPPPPPPPSIRGRSDAHLANETSAPGYCALMGPEHGSCERDDQGSWADVRDGVAQRNYGNGGSWPEAAEARRRQRCPRCDADTSEARARAEADGVEVDPMGDPVEQARAGRHPLGWCEACAENNRLIDVSGGF